MIIRCLGSKQTLGANQRNPSLSDNYCAGLEVMWTSETADILYFNWSVRCFQILLPKCYIHWDAQTMRCQLTRSLRNDREQRWVGECKGIKKRSTTANSRILCRLFKSIGPLKPSVSEVGDHRVPLRSVGRKTLRSSLFGTLPQWTSHLCLQMK